MRRDEGAMARGNQRIVSRRAVDQPVDDSPQRLE
jgi:hypothetical protein